MKPEQLQPDAIVWGDVFPEQVKVITVSLVGSHTRIVATGIATNKMYRPTLNAEQIAGLECHEESEAYKGDAELFQLGIEAFRISHAYNYAPYFALSLANIDPLPHQLDAVYNYFLKAPQVRFLLADDPGAGKTIMAGLLLKELKVRGLVKRTLIITPANLSFQWQRELQEKFRENFELMRGDVLRANYGTNPWQERNQVITSVSWVSVIEDAKDSLLRSNWDLIIVDEAHKMAAHGSDKKTLAYKLGEELSKHTDHYLLMTATPHKGDPEAFCLFLQLLDRDVYANVKSLEEAIKQKSAPFYLRRTKEALVTFPDKDGRSKRIFTRRHVKTVEFQINEAELELYDALTDYVEEQSVKAAMDNSPAARAIGFTMAMLQRRFASSVYAVRKTLERMADNRKKILADPEKYRQDKIDAKIPDDFDDYSDEEQIEILSKIENVVPSVNPVLLREEIATLETLITKAKTAESQEIETKLAKLKQLLQDEKVFGDKKMKILIFTEHKDTLDYLVGKLREWGLAVTQIHGSMKVGDRETRGTRIYAEREFREYAQVLVATEAAGEGINLQFCWLMVNYDIPWNPVRLEQRMGRIHRYGQEKECLIHNFVSVNTREGRVMQKLFDRIEQIENDLDPEHTGKVFNVLGDIFPANQIEKWVREMYAKNQMDEELLKERIVEDVDTERLRKITDSALEGLAKRNLNLGAIIRDKVTAKERRLVPQVIENFFRTAAAKIFLDVKVLKPNTYKIEKLPQRLIQVGNELETQNGRIGTEYKRFVFDREKLAKDPTCEWVTPGHPLFEAVRQFIENRALKELQNGTVLYDINTATPYHLDVFIAEINDGLGKIVIEKLLCVKTDANGEKTVKEPTLFLDLTASGTTAVPAVNRDGRTPGDAENFAIEYLMQHVFPEVQKEREHQTDVVREHLIMSLDALIDQANYRLCDFCVESDDPMFEANKKMAEDHFTDLEIRKKTRLAELKKERQVMPGNIRHIGKAWILPNPEREKPAIKPMLKDDEIEKIAVDAVIKHEEANGYTVVSVEADNCGYDLRSVHPVTNEVRFIEVKGRAATGDVLLTPNEKQTAERLQDDYYLYIVLNCAETPEIHIVRNPAKEQMQPVVKHYIYKLKDTE